MNTKIQKWGNSLAVRIPNSFAKTVELKEGNEVSLKLVDNKIIVEKERKKNKYSLKILMSKVTKENIHDEIDFGVPVGKEIL
jgi:antitoxin MazE